MRKILVFFFLLFSLTLIPSTMVRAQTIDSQQPSSTTTDDVLGSGAAADQAPTTYLVAKIISGPINTTQEVAGTPTEVHSFKAKIMSGGGKGQEITIQQSDLYVSNQAIVVHVGDQVTVVQTIGSDGAVVYQLADAYRIPSLWWALGLFFLLAIVFGRWRGFTSMLGLAASAAIIIGFIVPRIVAGGSPLWTSLGGALAIACVSLFLAHGFNKRTTIAFVATVFTLLISAVMAVWAVSATHLFGMGSEESLYVLSSLPNISLQGLLLGGIMLGLLGVLDDITTAQSAVVDELKSANPELGFKELYHRGLSVGREHIASLINTLFLAYAGAALPLFLLFSMNQGQPLWTILNNEMVAEEIVRTIVGSACLILAVPISTLLAAYVFRGKSSGSTHSSHHH